MDEFLEDPKERSPPTDMTVRDSYNKTTRGGPMSFSSMGYMVQELPFNHRFSKMKQNMHTLEDEPSLTQKMTTKRTSPL
jgi:hypothetical protein